MKTIILKVLVVFIFVLTLVVSIKTISSLKKENARLADNIEVLISSSDAMYIENSAYKVADSLNAIKINDLEFTVKELRVYKADSYKVIEQLKVEKQGLKTIIETSTATTSNIKIPLVDSVFTKASDEAIAKVFSYKSKYTDVSGCVQQDSVELDIVNREDLTAVEHVTKKKFIGLKLPIWLFGFKDRQLDIVSLNPNTTIIGVEYINIKE